jgi:hypothetical protein
VAGILSRSDAPSGIEHLERLGWVLGIEPSDYAEQVIEALEH